MMINHKDQILKTSTLSSQLKKLDAFLMNVMRDSFPYNRLLGINK